MTQYARPDSDVSDGDWLNSAGNNTNLYSYVDEDPNCGSSPCYNDSDYIYADDDFGSTETVILGLGDVTQPSSDALHKFTVRVKESTGMGGVEVDVYLLCDGSEVAMLMGITPSDSFANDTYTLDDTEVENITDYSALSIKIEATDNFGSEARTSVSWVYFECPDAASSDVSNPAFLLFVD